MYNMKYDRCRLHLILPSYLDIGVHSLFKSQLLPVCTTYSEINEASTLYYNLMQTKEEAASLKLLLPTFTI